MSAPTPPSPRPRPAGRTAPDRGRGGFGLVEALVAIVVFGIGALTVAGLSLRVGQLHAQSALQTDQTFAADQVFGTLREADFDAVSSETRTVEVGGHSYTVELDVGSLSSDTKQVTAVVSGAATFPADTFRTVLHRAGTYPSGP